MKLKRKTLAVLKSIVDGWNHENPPLGLVINGDDIQAIEQVLDAYKKSVSDRRSKP